MPIIPPTQEAEVVGSRSEVGLGKAQNSQTKSKRTERIPEFRLQYHQKKKKRKQVSEESF
jgi:hypothetical protein